MLRSLFAGITGLRGHQTMMDVTGNNIANVNTTGFKGSSTTFQDLLSQVISGAGAPTAEYGGTNEAQIGLGSRVAAITTNSRCSDSGPSEFPAACTRVNGIRVHSNRCTCS